MNNIYMQFSVSQQRDAADCLDLILCKVSPRVSEVRILPSNNIEKPECFLTDISVLKLFEGQLTYTTKCSKGHVINEETNPFWTLPLSLRDNPDEIYSMVSSSQGSDCTPGHAGFELIKR